MGLCLVDPNSKVWNGVPQLAQNLPFVPYDWPIQWPRKAIAQLGPLLPALLMPDFVMQSSQLLLW